MVIFKKYISKDYALNYCRLIKPYFILSLIIFIVSILSGYFFADSLNSIFVDVIKKMVESTAVEGITFKGIFFNNVEVNIIMMLWGFLFSIVSTGIMIFNSLLIGYLASVIPLHVFLAYVLPHGILELSALILSLATSFMVTHIVIRCIRGILAKNHTFKAELITSKNLIVAVGVSVILCVVLLFFAGIIETYVTSALADFILSLFS